MDGGRAPPYALPVRAAGGERPHGLGSALLPPELFRPALCGAGGAPSPPALRCGEPLIVVRPPTPPTPRRRTQQGEEGGAWACAAWPAADAFSRTPPTTISPACSPAIVTGVRGSPAIVTGVRGLPAIVTGVRGLPAIVTGVRGSPAIVTGVRGSPAIVTGMRGSPAIVTGVQGSPAIVTGMRGSPAIVTGMRGSPAIHLRACRALVDGPLAPCRTDPTGGGADAAAASLLAPYREGFADPDGDGGLEKIERRFRWLRQQQRAFDSKLAAAVPVEWGVPQELAVEFCLATRAHVDEQLRARQQNVEIAIRVLQKTLDFERDLTAQMEQQKGGVRKSYRYHGFITSCFESMMGAYVEHEETQMTKLVRDLRVVESKVAAGFDADIASPTSGPRGDGTLPAAADVFFFIKESMRRCTALSRGDTLAAMHGGAVPKGGSLPEHAVVCAVAAQEQRVDADTT
eukprot:gene33457-65585_t